MCKNVQQSWEGSGGAACSVGDEGSHPGLRACLHVPLKIPFSRAAECKPESRGPGQKLGPPGRGV